MAAVLVHLVWAFRSASEFVKVLQVVVQLLSIVAGRNLYWACEMLGLPSLAFAGSSAVCLCFVNAALHSQAP